MSSGNDRCSAVAGMGRAHPDIVSAHRLLFQGWQLVFHLLSTDRVFASGNLAFFNTPVCEGSSLVGSTRLCMRAHVTYGATAQQNKVTSVV